MIHYQYPLRHHNTLALDAKARMWLDYASIDELQKYRCKLGRRTIFPYGEGSNLVLCGDIENICVYNNSHTITAFEKGNHIYVLADAGVHWCSLVQWCLQHNFYGLESLHGIPGTCGAAPVQNIGAYGAEFSDLCAWVDCFDWENNAHFRIKMQECRFGYRTSLFQKHPQWIITRICLRLTQSLANWHNMREQRIQHSSLIEIASLQESKSPYGFAKIILEKRNQKLPDPKNQPNVGSFFHNPIVEYAKFTQLFEKLLPLQAAWHLSSTHIKISAAWLIDSCLGKGFRMGTCALSQTHALCIVNLGKATGMEIITFAQYIQDNVASRYNIHLSIEPQIVGLQHTK